MKFPENFVTTEFLNRLRKAHGVAGGASSHGASAFAQGYGATGAKWS